MKTWIAFLSIILSGCASLPESVVASVQTETVFVPVLQACVDAKDIPVIPPTATNPDGDGRARVAGMAIDGETYYFIAQKQQALLKACVTKP